MARKPSKATMKDYVLGGFLVILLVWLIFQNISIFHKEQIARHAAQDSQVQLTSLQSRQATLQSNVNELSTERGQEATLRETFGVAKPGEEEIVVVPPQTATTTPKVSWWQQWFGWLKF